MVLNQADPQNQSESDQQTVGMERATKCKHDLLVTSCPSLISDAAHCRTTTLLTDTQVWRQFIYDWRLLKLSAAVPVD